MKYNEETYMRAREELQRRRSAAEALAKAHRDEVLKKYPELELLETEMRTAVSDAVALLGKDGDIEKTVKKLRARNLQAQRDRAELIKLGGYPKNYLDARYTCPLCEDTGYKYGRFCTCHLNLLKSYACEALSKSSPSALCSFDNFDITYYPALPDGDGQKPRVWMSKVLKVCRAYADTFAEGADSLHFCGKTGLGKTHLSLAIASALTERGYNIVYTTAQKMLGILEKEHFTNNGDGTAEELYLTCDLLIIDDLGTEFQTSFTTAALYNIINTRLLTEKPVIVNSNLSAEELEEKYGERLASRIGSYTLITFRGADIRQLKKEIRKG